MLGGKTMWARWHCPKNNKCTGGKEIFNKRNYHFQNEKWVPIIYVRIGSVRGGREGKGKEREERDDEQGECKGRRKGLLYLYVCFVWKKNAQKIQKEAGNGFGHHGVRFRTTRTRMGVMTCGWGCLMVSILMLFPLFLRGFFIKDTLFINHVTYVQWYFLTYLLPFIANSIYSLLTLFINHVTYVSITTLY